MTTSKSDRNEPGYERHVFICGHERPIDHPRGSCAAKGSLTLLKMMKKSAKESGVKKIRVQKSGCLNYCEHGPSCVVYPEGTWYHLSPDGMNVEKIVERHLLKGEIHTESIMHIDKK